MWGEVSGTNLLSKPLKMIQEQITHWAADDSVVWGHFQLMKRCLIYGVKNTSFFFFFFNNLQDADDAIA